jgi:hypothetical protein
LEEIGKLPDSISMKPDFAKISLAVAVVFLLLAPMMLCDCPEFYILSSIFSGIAFFTGNRRVRVWSSICLGICLIIGLAGLV